MLGTTLLSSNAIPVTQDSQVLVNIWTTYDSPIEVYMKILSLGVDDRIIETIETIQADFSTYGTAHLFRLTPDRLISVSLWTGSIDAPYGKIFARIALKQTDVTDNSRTTVLTSGYLTGGNTINWPTSEPKSSLDGLGSAINSALTQPAAGAEIDTDFGIEQYTDVLNGKFVLTTSAAVANRTVKLRILVESDLLYEFTARSVQAAGVARNYWLWPGPNMPTDAGTEIYLPIPPNVSGPGVNIKTVTTNIQAGDQFSGWSLNRRHLIIPQ